MRFMQLKPEKIKFRFVRVWAKRKQLKENIYRVCIWLMANVWFSLEMTFNKENNNNNNTTPRSVRKRFDKRTSITWIVTAYKTHIKLIKRHLIESRTEYCMKNDVNPVLQSNNIAQLGPLSTLIHDIAINDRCRLLYASIWSYHTLWREKGLNLRYVPQLYGRWKNIYIYIYLCCVKKFNNKRYVMKSLILQRYRAYSPRVRFPSEKKNIIKTIIDVLNFSHIFRIIK